MLFDPAFAFKMRNAGGLVGAGDGAVHKMIDGFRHRRVRNIDALATLCQLAILVNLALFFFNLLPIPPLDGSRILRNFLPYNMANSFDKIGILGYFLMILVGGPIVRFFLTPAMGLVYFALSLVQRG